MKKPASFGALINPRTSVALFLISGAAVLILLGSGLRTAAEDSLPSQAQSENSGVEFGQSVHNDVSPPLRDLPPVWPPRGPTNREDERGREARKNPKLPLPLHVDESDPVIDHGVLGLLAPNAMPETILNFDGILYPGVNCNCIPPDSNGAVGATQYVQIVNEGYQVFNKTGGSVLGPVGIATIWSGFGGVCQNNAVGDPIVLYDHLANRWLVTQFAGIFPSISDECIAVSTTSDATGSYNRYDFHLGSNFYDYPKFAVWPDGYYLSVNVFNAPPSAFLGPQAFAFDRSKMLIGAAATSVSPGITGGGSEPSFLPADLDGSILPPATGNPYVSFPGTGTYKVRLFHADFITPANTTFNQIGAPAAAGFTALCPGTINCVPQAGTSTLLDGLGDRLMFRAAYRKFGDGHESIVGNYTVSASGVAGVRWFELRGVTTAPVVFQESTYQPDATWRWLASAAMDQTGNLAVGFSASSSTINPQIRYAGRLATDPLNSLAQGEATLFAGTGSQTNSASRWGDYSAMSIDPVDDCTFWYTNEYLSTTGGNWRTRIGNFKFPNCTSVPTPTPTVAPSPTPPPTPTPGASPLPITISLPVASVDVSTTNFTQPVTSSNINASFNLIGFQGDITFDETVVTFQNPPVSGAGLTATNWNVSGNVLPGGGPIRTLRISAFSNDFTPLSGSGTLFNLNMTRVSSSPGASTPLVWAASPNDFEFIDTDLNIQLPSSTPPGSITISAATMISISGSIGYCSNATLPPVPGVTLTLTGSASATTSSDGSGNYSFTSLTSGGSYTVTLNKTPLAPASNGISTVDVVAVQRHFLGITLIPAGCRLTAADVNGDSNVTTVDVVAIQRFFLGLSTGIANVGKYNFTPASRSYRSASGDQTKQDYNALVFGDVAASFVHQ